MIQPAEQPSSKTAVRRVILRWGSGSWADGFPLTLQIASGAGGAIAQWQAHLDADRELQRCLEVWRDRYHAWLQVGLSADWARPTSGPKSLAQEQAIAACTKAAQQLRDRLNRWLRQPAMVPLREAWLTQLRPEDELQIILQAQDESLQRLPWHQWELLEHYPQAEIALGNLEHNYCLQECLQEQDEPGGPVWSATAPMKILAIVADGLSPGTEAADLGHDSIFGADVTCLTQSQLLEQGDSLWQHLVILNTRDGLKLVQTWADLPVPQLIVMGEPVAHRVVGAFVSYFLAAYAQGTSLYPAVRQARERLQALEGDWPCATWLPVIYQSSTALPPRRSIAQSPAPPAALAFPPPKRLPWMGRSPLSQLAGGIGMTFAVAAVLGTIHHLGWLQPWELQAYDQLLRLRPEEPPDSRLLIIALTEAELGRLLKPSPQGAIATPVLSQLLASLHRQGAGAIGLDLSLGGEGDRPGSIPPLKPSLELPLELPQNSMPKTLVITCPTGAAATPDPELDPDGILRRQTLTLDPPPHSPCTTPQSLSSQLALQWLDRQRIEPMRVNRNTWQWGKARLRFLGDRAGGNPPRQQSNGEVLLNYRFHKSVANFAPQISLEEALTQELPPWLIRDRIILIGRAAAPPAETAPPPATPSTGFVAIPTPYGSVVPRVVIQAQAVSQLLSAALDGRVLLWRAPAWGDWLWIGLWAGVGGSTVLLLGRDRPGGDRRLDGLSGLSGVWAGELFVHSGLCLLALIHLGCWLPLLPASLALLVNGGLIWRWQRTRSKASNP